MQNAKDTFFVTLRNRLEVVNPDRTVVVRGAVRPAVVVLENELEFGEGDPYECFVLLWQAVAADVTEPMTLESAVCEIRYQTRGTGELAGMDRGRVLDAMDGELRAMLLPAFAAKQNFSGSATVAMGTNVFWSAPVFGAAVLKDDEVSRSVTVHVFALEEAGEA